MPPLVLPALACLAGALGGASLCLIAGMTPELLLLASTAGALAAAAWAALRPGRLVSTGLLAACVGAAAWSASPHTPVPRARGAHALDGILSAPPTPSPQGCQLTLTRTSLHHGRRWQPMGVPTDVSLRGGCPAWRPGDHVRLVVTGAVRAPSTPGARPRFRADRAHGVRLLAATAPPPDNLWFRLRRAALSTLRPRRGPGRALLAALLVGARGWLSPRSRAQFRRAGAAHLLAISGLHVGLVAWLVFGLLRRLLPRFGPLVRRVPAPQIAALVALGLTWTYVAVSGAGLPAQRAGWMASALLAAPLVGRRANPWSALSLAALVTTIRDPGAWWSPGCQLSYVAVAGILLGARRMPFRRRAATSWRALDGARGPRTPTRRLLRWLAQLGWTSGVATLATAPLVALHFGPVTAAGVLVNLAALPVLSFAVVPLGMIGLAVSALSPAIGGVVISGAAASAAGLLAIVSYGAQTLAPPLTMQVALSPAGAAAAYAVLLGLLAPRSRPGRTLLAGGLAAALILWLPAAMGPAAGAGYRIDVLDVGDGDAILLTFPGGHHALVDAPGSTRPGRHATRLLRRLNRLGVRRLDFVLATHPHADHVGGLPDVIDAIPTRVLYHGGQASTRPEWRRLLDAARARRVPVRLAHATCYRAVCVRVLWPRRGARVGPWPTLSENDNSVVLRIESPWGNALLAADLEHAGEAALLNQGRPVGADVLKLAHHGRPSASSLAFLQAVSPRLAVVSAGPRASRLTRHSRAVRRRLGLVGARVLSTHSEGHIRITVAPWGIRVQTHAGGDWHLPPSTTSALTGAPLHALTGAPLRARPAALGLPPGAPLGAPQAP